jgi:hypothetical protein
MSIKIPVAELEFVEGGKTLWIHSAQGSTVLRLKFTGGITMKTGCINIGVHADAVIDQRLEFCVPVEGEVTPAEEVVARLLRIHENRDPFTAAVLARQMIAAQAPLPTIAKEQKCQSL